MSEDRERFGTRGQADEPDVEAHRMKVRAHEEAPDDTEKKDDDEPDVEAHRMKTR